MKKLIFLASLVFLASGCNPTPEECITDTSTDEEIAACMCEKDPEACPDSDPSFKLNTTPMTVAAGTEITYCYYFRTPNTGDFAIKAFSSTASAGVASLSVTFTDAELGTPGTISDTNCSMLGSGPGAATLAYLAQPATSQLNFPANDGAGKPVAMTIGAGRSGFILLHVVNATDTAINAQAEVQLSGYAAGTSVTEASTFSTYNGNLNIPPSAAAYSSSYTCAVPANVKFFSMTTHSHKQSISTTLKDGATTLFQSTNWENPGATSITAAPFYTFESGGLTYQCEYSNQTSRTIQSGDSFETDETCMALTYFFPATQPVFCYNNVVF